MANPRWAEASVPKYLPDRVAQAYYALGLFCASHSTFVITLTSLIILLCSFPLSNIPLPGNIPQSFSEHSSQVNISNPRWFYGSPKYYVQQVVLKSTVSPWNEELLLTDAFRGPLAEAFKLVESIHNYQQNKSSMVLDHLCLHIEDVKKKNNKMEPVLPEYKCLILSPANLWQQDFNKFQQDPNLINTVYNYQNFAKGKISISEMLFGLPLQDAGIKRYPLRKKQRVIQYAVTIFMNQFRPTFIEGLHEYLNKLYPTSSSLNLVGNNNSRSHIHIYFPEDVNYGELIPLSLTYSAVFLYLYFSMRKVEYIKSNICLAFGAFLTVLASLCMTIGICFFFGLEFTGGRERVKQVFPYLVIIVGLENVLVLIKSVVSTTSHLDVKIRVAQGLSREGWNITKTLLIEVTVLTAGLLTFVPAIQEFCILAIVGLLSDFFLQIIFFSTILSLNVECSEPTAYSHYTHHGSSTVLSYSKNLEDSRKLPRSRSHPRLSGQNVVAPVQSPKNRQSEIVSKRVKVVHFWARTRFVQRSFMVGMVLWISVIVYNADSIQNFIRHTTSDETDDIVTSTDDTEYKSASTAADWHSRGASLMSMESKILSAERNMKKIEFSRGPFTQKWLLLEKDLQQAKIWYTWSRKQLWDSVKVDNVSKEYNWLKKVDYDTRRRLSVHHWSSILSLYNITVTASYITILPTINVVHVVNPQVAESLRNPDEKGIKFRWQSLAVALDPLDFPDVESTVRSVVNAEGEELLQPFIPSSPMAIFMTALLCLVSGFVVTYTLVVLYRCICSRNYAEWRTSWSDTNDLTGHSRTQFVMEALPVAIEGHTHLIECVSTDGSVIASSCLGGQVKIWDGISGEQITHIERNLHSYRVNSSFNAQDVNYGKNVSTRQMMPNGDLHFIDEYKLSSKDPSVLAHSSQTVNPDLNADMFKSFSVNINHPTHVLDKRKENEAFSPTLNDSIARSNIFDKVDRVNVPVWCIDCKNNLVVLGCVDGCLEFWECVTGKLKCIYAEGDGISITAVKLVDNIILAAKLNGTLCSYKLDFVVSYDNNELINGMTKHRRGHLRTYSVDSMYWQNLKSMELQCSKIEACKVHSKTITVLEVEGGRIITGSEDRTLKVFNLENQTLLYTLHGHYGPVTCVFVDRFDPSFAGSGSQDGLLCVWDLHTGACMYSIQAHDGTIFALAYSDSYVISLGQDEKLCVWDRFQGHLLNTIPVVDSYCTSICMLTHNLLITSKQGSLVVLDAATGETIRLVKLGSQNSCVFIRHILNVGDGIVCDYGDELRLVRFPLVYDKND